jgi:hypothetical protein
MKCFLSQSAALNSENTNDHFSKVVEVFSNYIRAPQRKAVNLIVVSDADRQSLNVDEVSSVIAF